MAAKSATKGRRIVRQKLDAALPASGGLNGVEMDVDSMLLLGRANVDTLMSLNALAIDCIERCAERQVEAWNRMTSNMMNSLKLLAIAQNATKGGSDSRKFVGEAVQGILDEFQALTTIVARANHDALSLVTDRATANLTAAQDAAGRAMNACLENAQEALATGSLPGGAGSERRG